MARYQGAVEGKAEAEQHFLETVARADLTPAQARERLPDLAAVVDAVTSAFASQTLAPEARRNRGYY